MSFRYLWTNRKRPVVFSRLWFKFWAKRVWNFASLLRILLRRWLYGLRGATLGPLTVVGSLDLNGPLKRLHVGERTFISSGTHLALHDNIVIGARVVINTDVKILTASHGTQDPQWRMFSKPIVIEDYAWIAFGATILPGVRVGEGAVIGAGAVVSRNVPPYAIYVGNPAVQVGQRVQGLDFSPVDLCASYEAWLGK